MNTQNSKSPFVQCQDCSFITTTQGHLGIHRSKMHNIQIPDNIKTVTVVRLFPQGKPFYCCLCDNIIASFPNFKRHFKSKHKGISLKISAKCILCDQEFTDNRGAGVHLQRTHHIGKDVTYPVSPSPIISYVDLADEANNTTIAHPNCRRSRRIKETLETSVSLMRDLSDVTPSVTLSPFTTGCNHVDDGNIVSKNVVLPSSQFAISQLASTPNQSTPKATPKPVLHDLDMNDDIESITSPPPRPSFTSPNLIPALEPVVVLTDCTAGDSAADNSVYLIPSNVEIPESMVALNGSTAVEGDFNSNQPSQLPSTDTSSFPTSSLSHDPFTVPPPISVMSYPCPTIPVTSQHNHRFNQNPAPERESCNSDKDPFQNRWSSVFSDNFSWEEFSKQCYNFADDVIKTSDAKQPKRKSGVPRRPLRPSARPVNNNRASLRYNPREAKRIQALYRMSKKRAARKS